MKMISEFTKKIAAIITVICMVMTAVPAATVSAADTTAISLTSEGWTVISTKEFIGTGTVGKITKLSSKVHNYNPESTGYAKAKFKFSSTFKKNLKTFLKETGKNVSTSKGKYNYYMYPALKSALSTMTLKDTEKTKAAWTSKSCLDKFQIAVQIYDTNDDGVADKARIRVIAYGKDGYSNMCGDKTVNLKTVRKKIKKS